MAKKARAHTDKQRQVFADFLRQRKPAHILRSISAAYNWASDQADFGDKTENERDVLLHKALRRHSLEGYTLNGRQITYSQARIVYEMVKLNKYGELTGKAEQSPRPEGCFPMMIAQTPEAYLKEYESKLCSA